MRVHTATLRYTGEDRVNITRGSGTGLGLWFAPSDALLRGYQRVKRMGLGGAAMATAWARYAASYREETARVPATVWTELTARDEATLCCYCPSPSRCHRGLLAEMLVARGATYEGEREL